MHFEFHKNSQFTDLTAKPQTFVSSLRISAKLFCLSLSKLNYFVRFFPKEKEKKWREITLYCYILLFERKTNSNELKKLTLINFVIKICQRNIKKRITKIHCPVRWNIYRQIRSSLLFFFFFFLSRFAYETYPKGNRTVGQLEQIFSSNRLPSAAILTNVS